MSSISAPLIPLYSSLEGATLYAPLPPPQVPFIFLLYAPSPEELRLMSHPGLHELLERVHYGLSFVSFLIRYPSLFSIVFANIVYICIGSE